MLALTHLDGRTSPFQAYRKSPSASSLFSHLQSSLFEIYHEIDAWLHIDRKVTHCRGDVNLGPRLSGSSSGLGNDVSNPCRVHLEDETYVLKRTVERTRQAEAAYSRTVFSCGNFCSSNV